jgi:hypothetical protein
MGLTGLADPQHLDDADHERYQRFILAVFGKRARALGWKRAPGDSDERHELRAFAGRRHGDRRETRAWPARPIVLARAWLADPRALDEDLVEPALGAAARRGDAKLFERLRRRRAHPQSQHERTLVAAQLGAFTDPALAERARGLILGSGLDSPRHPQRDPGPGRPARDASRRLDLARGEPRARDRRHARRRGRAAHRRKACRRCATPPGAIGR